MNNPGSAGGSPASNIPNLDLNPKTGSKSWWKECFALQLKILTLSASSEDFESLKMRHVPWGLIWVWLAGIGRAWDNPTDEMIIRVGLPSILYVFALSFFLWVFIAPLGPRNWRYGRVLALVTMTALPGLLYAVPFEMMLPPDDAITANSFLLVLVATWRVAMLACFLFRSSGLTKVSSVVALCLPLSVVMVGLMVFDRLERTFAVMGGFRYVVRINEDDTRPVERDGEPFPGKLKPIETRGKRKHLVYKESDFRLHIQLIDDLNSASGKKVKRGYEPPPGFKEIPWDDPEYLPPNPVIAVARILGKVSLFAAPVMFLYYLWEVFRQFGMWLKRKRAPKVSEGNSEAQV